MLRNLDNHTIARTSRFPEAMLFDGCDRQPCRIEDLTPRAACVRSDSRASFDEGAEVTLEIANVGRIPAEVVTMPEGTLGLMFHHDDDTRDAIADWLQRADQYALAQANGAQENDAAKVCRRANRKFTAWFTHVTLAQIAGGWTTPSLA